MKPMTFEPCPICGAETVLNEVEGGRVECFSEDCGMCGPHHDPDGTKWNRFVREVTSARGFVWSEFARAVQARAERPADLTPEQCRATCNGWPA
jgi:hypothetical protein